MTLEARRAAARRPRRHQDPLAAARLQRQPVLRGAVQDAQVPPGLPRALRLASRTRAPTAATSSPGTTASTHHSGIGLLTPADVHYGRASSARRSRRPCSSPRTPRTPSASSAAAQAARRPAHRGLDQQAHGGAWRAARGQPNEPPALAPTDSPAALREDRTARLPSSTTTKVHPRGATPTPTRPLH